LTNLFTLFLSSIFLQSLIPIVNSKGKRYDISLLEIYKYSVYYDDYVHCSSCEIIDELSKCSYISNNKKENYRTIYSIIESDYAGNYPSQEIANESLQEFETIG
jgi:hypothetical protein